MLKLKMHDDLFRCRYILYVGDFDEFIDEVRRDKAYPGDPRSHVDAICMELSSAITIWMPKLDPCDPEHIGTLAHECLHAVQFRLKGAGVSDAEIEVPAYYIDWLMCGFLKKLKTKFAASQE
jgi:hypothetical protein